MGFLFCVFGLAGIREIKCLERIKPRLNKRQSREWEYEEKYKTNSSTGGKWMMISIATVVCVRAGNAVPFREKWNSLLPFAQQIGPPDRANNNVDRYKRVNLSFQRTSFVHSCKDHCLHPNNKETNARSSLLVC